MDERYWKDKKVLITGGTGFVGKNLVEKFDELGTKYFFFGSKDYDLTKKEESDLAFQTGNYDFIIHLAAFQAAGDWPMHHTGIQFYLNNLIHINTLESWRKYQPNAKFIGAGSNCSFPGDIPLLSEEDADKGPLHPSVYAYGMTKRLLRVGIEAYKDQYKLKGTMPIFATLYGPHDDFDVNTAHVASALIGKFCEAKKNNKSTVEIWGDGTQVREFMYVEDQINGLLMVAQSCEENLINLGSGVGISIRNLAQTIKQVSGFSGDIVFNPRKFVGIKEKVLNIDKAKREFGWTEKNRMHSLEEGLDKTIRWYNQYNR